ncbi:MAG: hypothetical protein HY690_07170 [Chloroflexi bacterium]|nr:hypothetical protein [Chloroflexota bacterium]
MLAIRRIYTYLLATAGLAMLASGAANLARILVEVLAGAPATNTEGYVREGVAWWGALALVGLPVWLVHWSWAQRAAAASRGERASVLRRLFVYVVLAGAGVAAANSLLQLLDRALELLDRSSYLVVATMLSAVPTLLVAAAVWLFSWRVSATDRAIVGEAGGSATLRRWYLYGAALAGALVGIEGSRLLVERLWQVFTSLSVGGAALVAAGAPRAVVGLAVWLGHWLGLPRTLGPEAAREDARATLRTVYLFLLLAVTVAGTLVGASQLLYFALARVFGVERPGGVGGNLLQAAAGPASAALVYGVGWAYQRAAIRRQAGVVEAPRQVGVRRFYTYLVALLALAAAALGSGGLLWTLADFLTSATGTAVVGWWREQVALFSTLIIVGLPVWLIHWRPAARASDEEASSLTRRLYTYLTLIAGSLALLGSLASVVFNLLNLALGGPSSAVLSTQLARSFAVAIVAAVVAAYHWQTLRVDSRRASPVPAEVSVEGAPRRAALVRLRAADAPALEQALATLRAQGVDVEVVD